VAQALCLPAADSSLPLFVTLCFRASGHIIRELLYTFFERLELPW
jgi:hypothetical protein